MAILVRKAAPERGRSQVARTVTVPFPVGGWDAQSPLAAMPIENAQILDNFIPRPGYGELRKGSVLQVSGIAQGAVQTLMTWRGVTDKLLACAGTSIYDATNQGPVNPPAIYSAATSGLWEWVDFANSAGTWVLAVNGADTPIKYDGATVTTTAFTAAALTPTKLALIAVHKRRLHMAEKNSLRIWFPLATDALAGACGLLDLGPVFSKGGTLACIGTTSLNYGTGLDDFMIYITTQGQVAMYQGTDPGDATKWALVGVYDLGYPMGPRSLVKYGSDLCIITTDGVIPLSQAIRLDRAQDDAVALTQRIQNAFHTATAAYPASQAWQGILYSKGSLAIFNIPSTPAVQYVQNVQTGAWCRFTGMDAACWGIANGVAYYGSGAAVLQWDVGAADNGAQITYDLKGAFSDFRSKGQKRFTMLRALMVAPSWITPAVEVDVDYKESVPTSTPIVLDVNSLVGIPRFDWSTVSGVGYVGAVRMRILISSAPQTALAVDALDVDEIITGDGFQILTQDPVPAIPFQLTSFDLVFEAGGLL